ncbi:MAG: hypothetical protein JWP37_3431 [Mucilaginibacter sp.]|nr:hypothetical protein [Mucilaginibacter sp.]
MNKCTNILIDSNYIGNVATGVYAYQSQTIQVKSNQMKNMTGPLWRGQFVQFNSVTGGGNVVGYNKCENIQGESNCEDGISIYNSSGLSTDPINIIGNWLRGGGPSTTGSGITLGDQGGSYIVAQNNIIVNTGYIGMHVAGGTNIQMLNNTIYSGAFAWSHLGLGSGNYSGKVSSNITISGNKVNWNPINIYYQAGSVMPTGWGTNVSNAAISASVLPTTLIDFH